MTMTKGNVETTPPSGSSGEQEIVDTLFAKKISYDSGVPIGAVLALTRRISELESRIRVLEMQKNWTRQNAEYRGGQSCGLDRPCAS